MRKHAVIIVSLLAAAVFEMGACSQKKPPLTFAECPSKPVPAGQLKGSELARYNICWNITVTGKIWNISPDSITMIDPGERTDENGSISLGGTFATGNYFLQAKGIATLKGQQAFDELPIESYKCQIDSMGTSSVLKDCVREDR